MIMDWAEKSGIFFPKLPSSIDKPDMKFGIPEMEDGSIRRMLQSFAPLQKRSYIVMELRNNLLKEHRTEILARFETFTKKAYVVLGDPNLEFKKKSQELILKDKQEASDAQFRKEREEVNRKRMMEKKQKEAEKAKRKADKERLRKLDEMRQEKVPRVKLSFGSA